MADRCCYQCQDRHVGCHSECDEYITWKAEHDKKVSVRNEAKHKQYLLNSVKFDAMSKAKRSH